MSSATSWDPALYLDFDDLRARPFADLLARVGRAPRAMSSTPGAGRGT